MFKTIKKEDVKESLLRLINENGITTSNDVKYDLRKNGFWALQANVSRLLRESYKEAGVTRNWNGKYYAYTGQYPEDEFVNEQLSETNN